MGSRSGVDDDVASRYRERPSRKSRDHLAPRRGEERFYEEDVEYTRRVPSRDVPRERERERDRDRDRDRETTIVREDVRRERSPPAFLREDYGMTSAGPMVLRAREREEFEFLPRMRRRSPSPSPERRQEEIIIRENEARSRRGPSPPREREEVIIRRGDRERDFDRRSRVPSPSREREEIIIREDRDADRRSVAPSRRGEVERGEIVLRDDRRRPRREDIERDEIIIQEGGRRSGGKPRGEEEIIIRENGAPRRGPPTEIDFERDEIVSRRGPPSRYDPGPPRAYEREAIIIDRGGDRERDRDARSRVDDYAPSRRARSRSRSRDRERDEVVIRRDRDGGRRGGEREREEIIIKRDRSASSSPSSRAPTVITERDRELERQLRAPDIHQNVITHHHHVYHDDMRIERSRPRTPPLPPSPPPPPPPAARERENETIEIHRRGERNGRPYEEDLIIRDERNESPGPGALTRRPPREDYGPPEDYRPAPYDTPPRRYRDPRDDRDAREEADFYNQRALDRAYPGEAYHGSTRDWAIVDVPPGTNRVRMDGAGGGAQEITWQKYNGVRRSRFMPEGASSDEGYGSEIARPAMGGEGRRYQGQKDAREGLWTEITKDLVIREALEEAGYEYEETDDFYYIIAYLRYDDVARLVGLSEDIRKDRRRRIKEMAWESRALPPPEERREPLMIEEGPRESRRWDREDEIYREREIVVRGGRPPY